MIILVGSESSGTGKSTLVTNLAVLFSEQGKSVVIVEMDEKRISATFVERRKYINNRRKASISKKRKALLPLPDYIAEYPPTEEYSRLSEKLRELNKKYEMVIIDYPGGLSPEFEIGLSLANLAIIPFKPLEEDLDTLPAIVEVVKKANNPKLVACAVITKYSDDAESDEEYIDAFFAKHTDTIRLIKPFIHDMEVYQQALSKGYDLTELKYAAEAKKEINALHDALRASYNKKRKSQKQTIAIEPSEMDDGSSEEQELENVPSVPADEFLSKTDDFSAEEFSNGLKDISDDELVERYRDLYLQHVRMDIQFQMMQGLIIMEAKRRYPSNQEFGKWVRSVKTLCLHRQPVRNRYMHLAEFFHDKPMGLISLTAAYEISAPINQDVAKAVYEIAKDKKLSVKEVKNLIAKEKSKSGGQSVPKNITTADRVQKLLKQVEGLSLNNDERVDFLTQCISEFQQLIDKAQHPTHDDE